jgi:hypothetical protein
MSRDIIGWIVLIILIIKSERVRGRQAASHWPG